MMIMILRKKAKAIKRCMTKTMKFPQRFDIKIAIKAIRPR